MGIASLILGISGLLIVFVCEFFGLAWVGSILCLLAIIFGAMAIKKNVYKGVGIGGLVTGIIGLVWGLIATIACYACIMAIGGLDFADLMEYISEGELLDLLQSLQ